MLKETGDFSAQDRARLSQLAQSEEARRLVSLLEQSGGVRQAAQAAAKGDAGALLGMMNQLISTREGASLVERISQKARESGLTE